jgi:hypothetical protein
MRRRLAVLLMLPLLAGLIGGCGSDPVDVEGNWMLVGARLPDGHWDPEDPEAEGRYFLQITDGKALGFAGCDEYQATIEQDGGDLDFADFEKTTRQGCDPDVVPDPLDGYLPGAIEAVTSVEMDDDLLVMRGKDTTLSFRKRSVS